MIVCAQYSSDECLRLHPYPRTEPTGLGTNSMRSLQSLLGCSSLKALNLGGKLTHVV